MQAPAVVPRARSPTTGIVLPLTDLVRDLLEGSGCGYVALVGPRGSGLTTAGRHLEARLPSVRFVDFQSGLHPMTMAAYLETCLPEQAAQGLVVYAGKRPARIRHAAVFELAPWGIDEAIEYTLYKYPSQVRDVMSRVDEPALLGGAAELWAAVLDGLANDPDAPDVRAALRATWNADHAEPHHPIVAILAKAAWVARQLRAGGTAALRIRPSPTTVREVARLLDEGVVPLLRRAEGRAQRMAVSLLHAMGATYSLSPGAELSDVQAPGADWSGSDLTLASLRRADLAGAQLAGVRLDEADVREARLAEACLQGSFMRKLQARAADLHLADLRDARAIEANFDDAWLTCVRLNGAVLRGASLVRARLGTASLAGADLTHADLTHADLRNANLRDVRFRQAVMVGARLQGAEFRGADLSGASLPGCDLAHMDLCGARLADATLAQSVLTGTRLAGANLRGASLHGARAADVNLEGADLRNAALVEVDFHMGSSRSGLVDSPIASEGSRTGFYTDESTESAFKSPEEIRKANLRGANLMDADIAGTDFYLVDLREATYSERQAEVFRRCKAILDKPPG